MDKLEVGKWYRIGTSIFSPSTVVNFEPDTNMGETCGVGVYCAWFNFKNNWYCDLLGEKFDLDRDQIKPLETLTPREALILLANGFELFHKNENFIVKINSGGLLLNKKFEGINWELCFLSDYSDFIIHALPEEAGK